MANPTDKPNPKFLTLRDVYFWENVYVASVETGQNGVNACAIADRAVERRQERMSDDLRKEDL